MFCTHVPAFRCPGRHRSSLLRIFPFLAAVTLLFLGGASTRLRSQAPTDTLRLTHAEAREAAKRANPELAATRLDTAIARGALRQAGLLRFNPSADVLLGTGGGGVEPGLSQEIEVFGQRGARVTTGRAVLDRARASVANATRLTIGEVDRAFYRLLSATRRTELADEILGLNQRLTDVAARQLAAGEISRLDYNLAVVELGRSRSRSLGTRRERAQLAVELGRLIGAPANVYVIPINTHDRTSAPQDTSRDMSGIIPRELFASLATGRAADADSLTVFALARRPDFAAQTAAVRQANAELRLTRREALPNLVARVVSEASGSGGGRVIRPGLGIALPFFNRKQGEVRARKAAALQSELDRVALAARVRAEIASALATYQSAAAEVDVLASTVLEPARQNRQLLEIAYREGKVGLPVLLLIRNQVIDAELDYWAAWLAEREAAANLAEATALNTGEMRGPR